MSEPEAPDTVQSSDDYRLIPERAYERFTYNPRAQENKRKMSIRKEDKVVVVAIAFLALYGGFLWWGSQPPPVKMIVPYPDLFVGPILKTVRPDPTLSAHPDGQVFWRTK
jgi:hypothetical protein